MSKFMCVFEYLCKKVDVLDIDPAVY